MYIDIAVLVLCLETLQQTTPIYLNTYKSKYCQYLYKDVYKMKVPYIEVHIMQ